MKDVKIRKSKNPCTHIKEANLRGAPSIEVDDRWSSRGDAGIRGPGPCRRPTNLNVTTRTWPVFMSPVPSWKTVSDIRKSILIRYKACGCYIILYKVHLFTQWWHQENLGRAPFFLFVFFFFLFKRNLIFTAPKEIVILKIQMLILSYKEKNIFILRSWYSESSYNPVVLWFKWKYHIPGTKERLNSLMGQRLCNLLGDSFTIWRNGDMLCFSVFQSLWNLTMLVLQFQ